MYWSSSQFESGYVPTRTNNKINLLFLKVLVNFVSKLSYLCKYKHVIFDIKRPYAFYER